MKIISLKKWKQASVFGSRRIIHYRIIILLLSTIFLSGYALADPVFTGNASSDFSGPGVFRYDNPGGMDVGMPLQFPAGTASGWDVKALCFYYNKSADTMFVGLDFYGVAGDADGDGDPGQTGPVLASLDGVDQPDLGGSESIVLLLDTDLDRKYEIAVGKGIDGNISSFGTYKFVGDKYAPSLGFGKRVSQDPTTLYANPSASKPDIEFTIADVSKLPGFAFSPGEPFSFRTTLFAGSLDDCGIGDGLVPGPKGTLIAFSPGEKGAASGGLVAGNENTTDSSGTSSGVQI